MTHIILPLIIGLLSSGLALHILRRKPKPPFQIPEVIHAAMIRSNGPGQDPEIIVGGVDYVKKVRELEAQNTALLEENKNLRTALHRYTAGGETWQSEHAVAPPSGVPVSPIPAKSRR